MWRELGLSGSIKETFAVIYGFWASSKKPVYVPIRIIIEITGLGKSTISRNLDGLISKGIITALRKKGKRSLYSIPKQLFNAEPVKTQNKTSSAPRMRTQNERKDNNTKYELEEIL